MAEYSWPLEEVPTSSWDVETIIDYALNLAKVNPNLQTRARSWLNLWLESAYQAWPWPFLHEKATAIELTAAATSLAVGGGNGGISNYIQRILDPIWVYSSDYKTRQRARIQQLVRESSHEVTLDPSRNTGTPGSFKVAASTSTPGVKRLIPTTIPDKAYLLTFDYIFKPADLSALSDVPLYPATRTMVQAVFVEALKWSKQSSEYAHEKEVLAAMTINDRVRFGSEDGTNDYMGLDSSVFR